MLGAIFTFQLTGKGLEALRKPRFRIPLTVSGAAVGGWFNGRSRARRCVMDLMTMVRPDSASRVPSGV